MSSNEVVTSSNWLKTASGSYSAVPFNTIIFTSAPAMWSSTTPTRVKIVSNRIYVISGKVEFEYFNGGGSNRGIFLRKNGSQYVELHRDERVGASVDNAQMLQINSILKLVQGDYLELIVYQDSGSFLWIYPTPLYGPVLSVLQVQ